MRPAAEPAPAAAGTGPHNGARPPPVPIGSPAVPTLTPAPAFDPAADPSRVLLDARETADALGVSERMLRKLTVPHGDLPAVRLGRLVRYRLSTLRAWAELHEQSPAR